MVDAGPWDRLRWVAVAAVSLLLLALSATGNAMTGEAATAVQLTVSVGVGGATTLHAANWLPIRVDIQNDGPSRQAILQIDDPTSVANFSAPAAFRASYTMPVSLPHSAHKQVSLLIPAANAQAGSGPLIRLLDSQSGTVLAQVSLAVHVTAAGSLNMGIVSSDPLALVPFSGLTFNGVSVTPARIAPSDLPDTSLALTNYDILAVVGASMSTPLRSAQVAALAQWVHDGGTLIVTGGAGGALVGMGGLGAVCPLPTTAGALPLSALSLVTDHGHLVSGATVISVLSPVAGARATLAQGQMLVALNAPFGQGHCAAIALDPLTAPLSSWNTTQLNAFWGAALAGDMAQAAAAATFGGPTPGVGVPLGLASIANTIYTPFNQSISVVLAALLNVAVPGPGLFIAVIAGYLLCVGPLAFIVLRRTKRQDWAWGVLPLLAVLFSGGTYGAAAVARGSGNTVGVVSIAELAAGSGDTTVTSFASLLTAGWGDVTLALPPDTVGTVASVGNGYSSSSSTPIGVRFVQGNAASLTFMGMSLWSSRTVELVHHTTLGAGLRATLAATPQGHLVGTIVNHTGLALGDCGLFSGAASFSVGTLSPGAARAVDVSPPPFQVGSQTPLEQIYGAFGAPPAAGAAALQMVGGPKSLAPASATSVQGREQNIVGSVFPNGTTAGYAPLTLLCFAATPLVPIQGNGLDMRVRSVGLIVADVTLTPVSGAFSLPLGVLRPQLISSSAVGPVIPGFNPPVVKMPPGGQIVVEAQVPHGRGTVVGQTLTVATTNGQASLAIWDWAGKRWQGAALSSQQVAVVTPAERFVSSDGRVRVQETSTVNGYIGDPTTSLLLGLAGEVR